MNATRMLAILLIIGGSLALLYGGLGSLAFGDRPGGGGLVRIRIPWRVAAATESPR